MQTNFKSLKRDNAQFLVPIKVEVNKKQKLSLKPEANPKLEDLATYIQNIYPNIQLPTFPTAEEFIAQGQPCHFAAQQLDVNLLKLLQSLGANINQLDIHNNNPLMAACKVLEIDIQRLPSVQFCVMEMLKIGCDPLLKDLSGNCALDLIGKFKLLPKKALIDLLKKAPKEHIHLCAGLLHHSSDTDVIDYLLQNKIDVNILDSQGFTPLYRALERGDIDTANHLVTKGADSSISLPFKQMATLNFEFGKESILKTLELFQFIKNQGRSLCEFDEKGDSLLIKICRNLTFDPEVNDYYTLLIEGLVILGCDLTQQNFTGESAIELLVKSGSFNEQQIHSLIDLIPEEKVTLAAGALHYTNDLELIKFMINKGVSIDSPDAENHTPLWHALKRGNLPLIRFYIENGASTKVELPFHQIAKTLNTDILEYFLQHNQNVKQIDPNGNNALMIACMAFDPKKYINLDISHELRQILEDPNSLVTNERAKAGDTRKKLLVKPSEEKQIESKKNTTANISNGHKFISKLLALGVNSLQKNKQGVCAAELFVKYELFSVKQLFPFFKSMPQEHLRTAPEIMFHTKNEELLNLFFNAGISIDTFNRDGNTLLHLAVDELDGSTIQILIKNGADPYVQRPKLFKRPEGFPSSPLELLRHKLKMITNAKLATNLGKYYQLSEKCEGIYSLLIGDSSESTEDMENFL